MKESVEGNGLVPARGFLEEGMAPIPSFNDSSHPGTCVASPMPSILAYYSQSSIRGDRGEVRPKSAL